jgi:nicotinate dehydrogenase subunit A
MLRLTVNGTQRHLSCPPETPLIYVLRNDLGLKGTRFGCGAGYCGACKVILDGKAVNSCDTPLSATAERDVVTIEGLAVGGVLHPLQQAFVEEQAAQCGYCSSGIIMAAAALLGGNPHPTDGEVRVALADNLCRCGSHARVLRAIRRAAAVVVAP